MVINLTQNAAERQQRRAAQGRNSARYGRNLAGVLTVVAKIAPAWAYLLPWPGLGLKCCSNLPSTPFQASASAGASPLRVMFGHLAA